MVIIRDGSGRRHDRYKLHLLCHSVLGQSFGPFSTRKEFLNISGKVKQMKCFQFSAKSLHKWTNGEIRKEIKKNNKMEIMRL